MKKYIVAIETSCDETSVAVAEKGRIVSNIVSSQMHIHAAFGGVIPEVASRMHVEQITYVIHEAMTQAGITWDEVKAIAVTQGPGLIGALHVGLQAAKTLAFVHQLPLIPVHHIAAHIYASAVERDFHYPALALVVSGGHSQLIVLRSTLNYEIIGDTQDDAIGEAYDKVARLLKLPYPGGPEIDRLAKFGEPTYALPIPKTEGRYNFSFSGMKTAVLNTVHHANQVGEEIRPNDMARSFQDAAVAQLMQKTQLALSDYHIKEFVLAGGVSANSFLRQQVLDLKKKFPSLIVSIPPFSMCTDNAGMVANVAHYLYDQQRFASLSLGVHPDLPLTGEEVL